MRNAAALILLLLVAAKCASAQTVCYTGFVMDTFCIERGTLLDNGALRSLEDGEGPQWHSYHCLLDVPQCYNGGYEMLAPPLEGSTTHCRVLQMASAPGSSAGADMLLAFFRAHGRPGACSTCTGTLGDETQGPRATVYGTIVDDTTSPPTLELTDIRPASEACNTTVYVPTGDVNCNSAELLPLFRMHGALMLSSWGALLPLGVAISLTGRHREPLWFRLHVGCQMLGLALALAGWLLALTQFSVFSSGATGASFAHACMGCVVMSLGLLQPINAAIRPHKDKSTAGRTARRAAWELWHKGSGYVAVLLSIFTIALGTRIISADNGAFQLTFGLLWLLPLSVGFYLKAVDAKRVQTKAAAGELRGVEVGGGRAAEAAPSSH